MAELPPPEDTMSSADVTFDDVTYEERRRTLQLLEKLTARARLELVREGNLIEAPVMQANAEGVLISEVLGIFLFLFLLLGMVVFFHKETRCATTARQRLYQAGGRLKRAVRRRLPGTFGTQWSCQSDSPGSVEGSQTGVYRDMAAHDDVSGSAGSKSPELLFDHRSALLELFADLELHREAVRDSIRGYSAALSQMRRPGARSGHGGSSNHLHGILRSGDGGGTPATHSHGKHRHGHHSHRHHRHAPSKYDVIAETSLNNGELRGLEKQDGGSFTKVDLNAAQQKLEPDSPAVSAGSGDEVPSHADGTFTVKYDASVAGDVQVDPRSADGGDGQETCSDITATGSVTGSDVTDSTVAADMSTAGDQHTQPASDISRAAESAPAAVPDMATVQASVTASRPLRRSSNTRDEALQRCPSSPQREIATAAALKPEPISLGEHDAT